MSEQIPTVGRIVQYVLSAEDAKQINRRRTTSSSIAERMKSSVLTEAPSWPVGAQAHIGNEAHEGDVFPMMIVRVWGPNATSAVNGQVFLDGSDAYWATSRTVGEQPGTYHWPTRA